MERFRFLLYFCAILLSLSGCTGGLGSGAQPQGNGEGFGGAINLSNAKIRCTSTEELGTQKHRVHCDAVVVKPDGVEVLATALARGIALDWQAPKQVGGDSFSVESGQVATNTLSHDWVLSLPYAGAIRAQFDLVVKETETQAQITVSDVLFVSFGNEFSSLHAMASQSDGKIVGVGQTRRGTKDWDIAVVRFTSSGALDLSFNGTGKVRTTIATWAGADSVAIQPNGKIVVGAWSKTGKYEHITLVRYLPDGRLDNSFNSTGKVVTAVGHRENIYSTHIQPDGKIVVAGNATPAIGAGSNFLVARYLTNGALDPSFGGSGIVTTDILGNDYCKSSILQPDGKIVLLGQSDVVGSISKNVTLVRYHSNGTLDASFNNTGILVVDVSTYRARPQSLAIQPDGKLVAVGGMENLSLGAENGYSVINNFLVARFTSNGALDPEFGNGGIGDSHAVFGGQASSIRLQEDGRILVAGSSAEVISNSQYSNSAAIRLLPDGTVDSSFGIAGQWIRPISSDSDSVSDILIQSNGTIWGGGQAKHDNVTEMTLFKIFVP